MSTPHSLQVANFICKFGRNINLLDRLDEIIIPAFFKQNERKYGKTTYLFDDVILYKDTQSKDPTVAICGRIIKNTLISRDQIYDPSRGLVESPASMPSAPSSFFALSLINHRLIYINETHHAPSLNEFRTTCIRFTRDSYKNYINEEKEISKIQGTNLSKKSLREKTPYPDIKIVPLASEESFKDFLHKFSTITELSITITDQNNEINVDEIFDALEKQKESFGGKRTTLTHKNEQGLSRDAIHEKLSATNRRGNHVVRVKGFDEQDGKISGTNDDFSIKMRIQNFLGTMEQKAKIAFAQLKILIDRNTISLPNPQPETVERISNLLGDKKDD